MQWVLDLFDKQKVSTRDVTDRYKAFGTGQGSIFWTGPWTLNGYVEQKLPFRTYLFPKIGASQITYFEMGGLELYTQSDPARYEATMKAVKWLSDNSFLWTTVGRGASPRKSILERAGLQDRRASLGRARRLRRRDELRHGRRDPGARRAGLHDLFSGGNFLAKTLETVWAGKAKPEEAMAQIKDAVAEGPRRGLMRVLTDASADIEAMWNR